MPIHSRITSINSFATGKTERVPIVSEYIEDYFNVRTNRPTDNTVPNKIETKGIDWTKAADGGTGEAEGLMWLKKLYETDDHSLWPKVITDMVVDSRRVGVGSAYLVSNDNYKLQDGEGNQTGYVGDAGIKFEKDSFTIQRSSVINNVYTTASTMNPLAYYSFKKKKKFFDVQVYTGDSVEGRILNHDLDCEPGCVMIKGISDAEEWAVYHKHGWDGGTPGDQYKFYYSLNTTGGPVAYAPYMIKPVGTTHVQLGAHAYCNGNAKKYIAFFFADAGSGGFGDDGSLDGIACGSGTVGDWNSADSYQDLGFEPQWVLVKGYSTADDQKPWLIVDAKRIMYSDYEGSSGTTRSRSATLQANTNVAQIHAMALYTDGGGFYIRECRTGGTTQLGTGDKYMYIAIASPQKTATQQNMFLDGVGTGGTNFYTATTVTAGAVRPTILPGFSPDSTWVKTNWQDQSDSWLFFTRKMGAKENNGMNNSKQFSLHFNNSDNKDGGNDVAVFYDTGFYANSDGTYSWDANDIFYLFKKTPHFYDTQHTFLDGHNPRIVKHNLGKKPELMISKTTYPGSAPSIGAPWWMYSSAPGLGYTMTTELNGSAAFGPGNVWGAEPTASTFTLGSIGGSVSGSGWAHTMLFSSCPGVSKVGFYTGTGSLVDIDCEFVNSPRFVQIQRTDNSSGRVIFDSYRGMSGFNGAGEQVWANPGDYTWTAPAGVTSISVVLIGAGGGGGSGANGVAGGGGGLAYKNNITVVPGVSYNLTVGMGGSFPTSSGVGSYYNGGNGGNSTLTVGSETYAAYGGGGGIYRSNGGASYPQLPGYGGSRSANTDGGGDGGRGGDRGSANAGGGGGGAGGYTGAGGKGGHQGVGQAQGSQFGENGLGGGSGGGAAGSGGNDQGGGGGGTGLYGQDNNGAGGASNGAGGEGGSVSNTTTPPGPNNNVGGGRNGTAPNWSNGADNDGFFGGGGAAQGGGTQSQKGAKGGIRIVWGESVTGVARTFPASSDAPYLLDPFLNWGTNDPQTTATSRDVGITTTGFQVPASASTLNTVGGKYIFLAIA